MIRKINLYIINNSQISSMDMSGGERIAIEFAKRWGSEINIFLYTSNLGRKIWDKYGVDNVKKIEFMRLKENTSVLTYFFRAIYGAYVLRRLRIDPECNSIIYSASDFWPDSIPAFFVKLKYKNIKWIAGFYLFAPKPWQRTSPYKGAKWFIGFLYWLTQLPVYWIVKKYADIVFVTSEPDVEKFVTKKRNRDKIVIVKGGVDTKLANVYLNSKNVIPVENRKYDACFIGRFHYQKGVIEIIDIWKIVCDKRPEAKLVMIGNGPLEEKVKKRIREVQLQSNVELVGFKDGEEKYNIFKQSKIVVHPAIYDSGGMAACEAMAWGLPAVSFDLEALKTYYPKGMLKVSLGDLNGFAGMIINLLNNKGLYEKMKKDAISLAREWDWDKRAKEIWNYLERDNLD